MPPKRVGRPTSSRPRRSPPVVVRARSHSDRVTSAVSNKPMTHLQAGKKNTGSVVPAKESKVLRYAETFNFTTGAAGIFGATQTMRVNSLFDPNQTSALTGHQPYYYDQIQNLYSNYVVKKAKVKLIWTNTGGTAEICCAAAVNTNSTGLTLAGYSVDAVTEKQSAMTSTLSSTGTARVLVQKLNLPIHKFFGKDKFVITTDDTFSALVSANPINQVYLAMAIASYTGVTGQAATCQVVIDYYADFYNPIDQAQS